MADDDDTQELIEEQHQLRRAEEARARRSDLEAEEHTHERRAEKAAYLGRSWTSARSPRNG